MKRWLLIAWTGLFLAATSQLSYAQVQTTWKISRSQSAAAAGH